RIVAEAGGPVKLEKGKAIITIPKLDLPNGTVSIYVIVWSKDYAASTSAKVAISSPVVADLDVPASLLAGDRVILPLRLENIRSAHRGDFAVRIAVSGAVRGVAVLGNSEQAAPPTAQAEVKVPLQVDAPKTVYL